MTAKSLSMYTTFLKRYGENLKNVPLRYRPLFTLVKWFGGISRENVKSMNKKCSNFEDFQYRLVAWRNSTRNDWFIIWKDVCADIYAEDSWRIFIIRKDVWQTSTQRSGTDLSFAWLILKQMRKMMMNDTKPEIKTWTVFEHNRIKFCWVFLV